MSGPIITIIVSHSRGINGTKFHPFRNLIVSSGHDRKVVLGLYTNDDYKIINKFHGHQANVSQCIFAYDAVLKCDIIISVSKDSTIGVWQCNNYQNQRLDRWSFGRADGGRYWTIVHHPNDNLFAAGHDNGFVIFKVIRKKYNDSFIINMNTLNGDIIDDEKEYEICIADKAENDMTNYKSYYTDDDVEVISNNNKLFHCSLNEDICKNSSYFSMANTK